MDEQGAEKKNEDRKDAAFWSCGSSGEPIRPSNRGVQESAYSEKTAVRGAIEERLRPVPSGVKSDGEPKIASAPNHETKEQAGRYHLQNAKYIFSVIAQMRGAEYGRKEKRCGPEAHSSGHREEPVATKDELFVP